ncbi:MAG: anthranilate phosphoribosyltransferase, partial [Candidatus Sumerlaeia bacterium]
MIQDAIDILVSNEDFETEQAAEVAREILNGEATPAQIAAFITALRIRGEKVEHIVAFARVLREKALRIQPPEGIVLDTCGTGGDSQGTFNVSTAAAIIAAAADVTVAKHGNRAVTSSCGSADVLKALGVDISCPPEIMEKALKEIGLCFLFAPSFHGAMKHAAVPRKEVGIRSIFNMVGPLVNPAGANRQIIGVYSAHLTETFAEVLRELGTERALVVHGSDGLDEITLSAVTQVTELRDGDIDTWTLDASDFGLDPIELQDILVESVEEAAETMRSVLKGEPGPCTATAYANAGAAIYLAGKANSIDDGYTIAQKATEAGKAEAKLQALIDMT